MSKPLATSGDKMRYPLLFSAAASIAFQASPVLADEPFPQRYEFLQGTTWYVSADTVKAIVTPPLALKLIDARMQEIWSIEQYKDGYFVGITARMLKYLGEARTYKIYCSSLIGSVDDQGVVSIKSGFEETAPGQLAFDGTRWRFKIQSVIVPQPSQWAVAQLSYRDQCKAGEPCQTQAPASKYGVPYYVDYCRSRLTVR